METKVPFYNITNIFLPGLVIIGSCIMLFLEEVKKIVNSIASIDNLGFEILITVACFAIAYEVGYIIFRIGAIIVEPILIKLFGWAKYEDFIAAGKTSEKAYNKLKMLSTEYGYARTRITLFIVLSVLTGVQMYWWIMAICIICLVLFTLTARGHMKKIQKAVNVYLTETEVKPQ
jgi:hypothetical protein